MQLARKYTCHYCVEPVWWTNYSAPQKDSFRPEERPRRPIYFNKLAYVGRYPIPIFKRLQKKLSIGGYVFFQDLYLYTYYSVIAFYFYCVGRDPEIVPYKLYPFRIRTFFLDIKTIYIITYAISWNFIYSFSCLLERFNCENSSIWFCWRSEGSWALFSLPLSHLMWGGHNIKS